MEEARRRILRIGIVVLAAGCSMRYGTPKQFAIYDGCSLLRRAAETALASVCRPPIVVIGAHADGAAGELGDLPVQSVVNPHWAAGIGSSIRSGIAALETEEVDGAVVMLCDQPLVTAGDIDALVAAFEDGEGSVIASQYAGTVGVPALFGRKHFPELKGMKGDEGAKKLIVWHRDEVFGIPNASAALDIDTVADFAKLRALAGEHLISKRGTP